MCIVIIFWYICYHVCRFRNYNTYSASTTERGVFQAIIRKVTLILVFVTLFTLSRFVILVAKLVIASKQPSDNAQVSSVSIYLYWRYIYICIYSEVINVCSTLALARLRYYYCSHHIYRHFNLFLHLLNIYHWMNMNIYIALVSCLWRGLVSVFRLHATGRHRHRSLLSHADGPSGAGESGRGSKLIAERVPWWSRVSRRASQCWRVRRDQSRWSHSQRTTFWWR
jgi:hypothetical protein